MPPPFNSLGPILALVLLVVCIVGLLLILGGVAVSANPLIIILVIGVVLALARLT